MTVNGSDSFSYRPIRWPIYLAAALFVTGAAMFAAAGWMHKQTQAASVAPRAAAVAMIATPMPEPVVDAPPYAMHTADLRALFKLAAERRLSLTSVDYQTEANRPASIIVRHLVLHVDEEYPKVKAYIAELLRTMPHSLLEEIQIEQQTTPQPSSRIQATIKLALVYRGAESSRP
jgi:hypothetical protein